MTVPCRVLTTSGSLNSRIREKQKMVDYCTFAAEAVVVVVSSSCCCSVFS